MLASEIREEDLNTEFIDRLLFNGIKDTGTNGDCIIVLGSRKAMKQRVPAAVKLYKSGRAPKIMMCGGITATTPGRTVSEADHMSLAAIDLGVPEDDIIVENISVNTIENILCAMLMLQREFRLNDVHRVLLVTASFHMRRALAIARYFFPDHIEVCPCPADDISMKRGNWPKTPESSETVINEAINLLMYVRNKVIPDFEV